MEGNLLLYNIGLLATPTGKIAKKGAAQDQITFTENAAISISDGRIAYAGPADGLAHGLDSGASPQVLDCEGALVTPGLVDCHTHLVFGGWRQKELPLKLAGAAYLDILAAGGGILSTVERTREASFDELFEKAGALLDESLCYGVTTLEAKSGYGLDLISEVKCLEVIKKLNVEHTIDLASTFMGAHAIPKEYKE